MQASTASVSEKKLFIIRYGILYCIGLCLLSLIAIWFYTTSMKLTLCLCLYVYVYEFMINKIAFFQEMRANVNFYAVRPEAIPYTNLLK